MIKEFAYSFEQALNGNERIVAEANERLRQLKDDPDLLEKYFDQTLAGLTRDEEAILKTSEMGNAIVEAILKEIDPKISLDPLDSKEFAFKFKGLNTKEIRLKVLALINQKGVNRKFMTPADEKPEPEQGKIPDPMGEKKEEPGYFRKLAKKHFPNGKTSHAEYSHPEYGKDNEE